MNNELERMQKEGIVPYFEAMYRNLPGGTEESTKYLSRVRRSPARDLNPRPVEYEGVRSRGVKHPIATLSVMV
jgi:hypothetical protein